MWNFGIIQVNRREIRFQVLIKFDYQPLYKFYVSFGNESLKLLELAFSQTVFISVSDSIIAVSWHRKISMMR